MELPGFRANERIGERNRHGPIPVPSRMNLRAKPWYDGLAGPAIRIAVSLAIVGTAISMFGSQGGGRKRNAELPGGGCPLISPFCPDPQPPGKADPCPDKVVRIDAADLAKMAGAPPIIEAGARESGGAAPDPAEHERPAAGGPGGEEKPTVAEAAAASEGENREAGGEEHPAPKKEDSKGTDGKHPRATEAREGGGRAGAETVGGKKDGAAGEKAGKRKGRDDAASEEKYSWTREEWEKMKFIPPSEKFEPLKEDLDPDDDDFALIWDTDLETRQGLLEASNIKAAASAVYKCFRFLRSHSPAELEAFRARREKAVGDNTGNPALAPANAINVMKNPAVYRGQPFTFYGALLRKFQVLSWRDEENNSGVEHTMLAFCRDDKNNIYAVLVPDPMRNARDRDEADLPDRIRWTGLFLQRWAYIGQDNAWHYVPLYAAWTYETLPPPSGGSNALLIGALAAIGLAVAAIAWYTQRQERRTEIARGFLRERMLKTSKKRLAASAAGGAGEIPEPGKAGGGDSAGSGECGEGGDKDDKVGKDVKDEGDGKEGGGKGLGSSGVDSKG